MKNRVQYLSYMLAAAVCLGAGLPTSHAAVITYSASLGPEVPGASGSGSVEVTYDSVAQTLAIDADWLGLSGVTTVAHIHCCTAIAGAGTIGVAVTPGTLPGFPVGIKAGSYNYVVDLTDAASFTTNFVNNFGGGTVAGAEAALLAGFDEGRAYFNIHTDAFPSGEIRGFLQRSSVPEPGTLALLGLGLAGLAASRRRS